MTADQNNLKTMYMICSGVVVADLFPLGLSVATLVSFTIMYVFKSIHTSELPGDSRNFRILLDVLAKNSPTARPLFTMGFLYGLSIFWLGTSSLILLCIPPIVTLRIRDL